MDRRCFIINSNILIYNVPNIYFQTYIKLQNTIASICKVALCCNALHSTLSHNYLFHRSIIIQRHDRLQVNFTRGNVQQQDETIYIVTIQPRAIEIYLPQQYLHVCATREQLEKLLKINDACNWKNMIFVSDQKN